MEDLTMEEEYLKEKYSSALKIKVKVKRKLIQKEEEEEEIEEVKKQQSSSTQQIPLSTQATLLKRPKLKVPTLTSTQTAISVPKEHYSDKFDILSKSWDSRENDQPLQLKLEEVVPIISTEQPASDSTTQQKNTIIIWATMPQESERFSFNIALTESYKEDDPNTVFIYHFNPRHQPGRQTIFQNTFKDGRWSLNLDKTIKDFPIEKDKPFELRLVFCAQGIAVYLNGKLETEFAYRYGPVLPKSTLYFYVPVKEQSYNTQEKVIIHRVWYGYTIPYTEKKPQMAFQKLEQTSSIRKVPDQNADRCLFVAGLPTDGTAESELIRIFEHYQVDSIDGRLCVFSENTKGQGVVKLQNSVNVSKAIQYLNNTMSMSGEKLIVTAAKKKQVPTWFQVA